MKYTTDEIKGFEQERTLIVQKLNSLRSSRIVQTDASVIFKLDEEFANWKIAKRIWRKYWRKPITSARTAAKNACAKKLKS